MKILTKGIYYYNPINRQLYIDQGMPENKIDAYLNDNDVMLWHDCEDYRDREETVRVSMLCNKTKGDTSYYECSHCGFAYELDNNLVLIESKG